jgi:hypothetical protein
MGGGDETQQPLMGNQQQQQQAGYVPVAYPQQPSYQQEFVIAQPGQPGMPVPAQPQVYYAQGPPVPGGAPVPTSPDDIHQHSTKHFLMEKHVDLQIMHSIKDGWRLYKHHWGWYTGFSLMCFVVSVFVYAGLYFTGLRGLNGIANLLFFPLWFGPFMAASHELRNNGMAWSSRDLFSGYFYYLPALGLGIMINLAIFIGLLLCIVPGIYLAFVLPFAPYVFIEYHGEVGFFDALDISRKVCHRNFCNIVGLWLMSILIALLGFLCLGVGIFVAMPVVALAWTAAFDQMFGMNPRKHKDHTCVGCC